MLMPLVELVPEKDGTSRYEVAVRNQCERGGYAFAMCAHEGNSEVVVRVRYENGPIVAEARTFPRICKMLLENRPSHLGSVDLMKPRHLSPGLPAAVLVGT